MKKILVTNEQYNKIAQKEADNYWKKCFKLDPKAADYEAQRKRISQEYDAILDQYEIIPFTINTDNEELKRIINILCTEEEENENKIKYKGMGSGSDIYTAKELLNMNFILDDYYSKSMYNDNLKLLIDYCEGDIYFTLCSNEESYQAEKQRSIKFYNENY